MIEKDLNAADVRVGGALAWGLLPYLIPYEVWLNQVESQAHLEVITFLQRYAQTSKAQIQER